MRQNPESTNYRYEMDAQASRKRDTEWVGDIRASDRDLGEDEAVQLIVQAEIEAEGTLSEGVRRHGLRRARYRGQPKTQLQAQAIAAAINLVRIHQMLQRIRLGRSPRPKRPSSPFARLRPLLAA